jgi:hypothetical protein
MTLIVPSDLVLVISLPSPDATTLGALIISALCPTSIPKNFRMILLVIGENI